MTTDCVFCKILAGTLPSARVAETDKSLSFLDIMPVSEGHMVVIPRRHAVTLLELNDEERDDLFNLVQRVTRACMVGLKATGVNLLQCNGSDAGQVVPHVHVHVVPRREGDGLRFHPPQGGYAEGRMEEVAALLRSGDTEGKTT